MRKSAEAVIIGGGLAGTSICFNLASRGVKDTVLLEKEGLGAGSTGKSSGVTTGFSLLLFTHGDEGALPISLMAKEGQKWFRNFKELVGAESGFREVGVLFLSGEEYVPALRSGFAKARELGFENQELSREDLKEIVPHLEPVGVDFLGFEPRSGFGDPPGVAQGFASAAGRMGAEISLGNGALDVEIEGGRVRGVVSEKGRIATDTVVVAGGPWNGGLMKKLGYDLPLQPTRHEVFVLKKGPNTPISHPVVFDLVEMTYMREESPDLMLGGDIQKDEHVNDPENFDQGTTMEQTQRIWGRLSSLMPSLADAELFTGFSGLYTNTPDNLPILGKAEGVDGLYFAGGFNGYGFKLSPAVGIVMSELITEGEAKMVDISSLGMGRFGGVTAL